MVALINNQPQTYYTQIYRITSPFFLHRLLIKHIDFTPKMLSLHFIITLSIYMTSVFQWKLLNCLIVIESLGWQIDCANPSIIKINCIVWRWSIILLNIVQPINSTEINSIVFWKIPNVNISISCLTKIKQISSSHGLLSRISYEGKKVKFLLEILYQ